MITSPYHFNFIKNHQKTNYEFLTPKNNENTKQSIRKMIILQWLYLLERQPHASLRRVMLDYTQFAEWFY